jgi:hypothetical protein
MRLVELKLKIRKAGSVFDPKLVGMLLKLQSKMIW